MSSQEEELEVLDSIYGDDPCFQKISNTKFQYKFGNDGSFKSFLLEIEWTENYPMISPIINLNVFYNQHTNKNFKTILYDKLSAIASHDIENPVTYTLFEHVRDNLDEYLELITVENRSETFEEKEGNTDVKKVRIKKEQLTKAQKRKQQDKLGENGEIPRGKEWVSVLRHLQQL